MARLSLNDFSLEPHQLAEGVTLYVKHFFIGFIKISYVTL